ncbi:putative fad fmn-containing isoamyl alcohol oxidase protein [Naviculisporaceae sp. PSN 640]
MSAKRRPDQQIAGPKDGRLARTRRQTIAWTSFLVIACATWFAFARAPQCRSFPGDKSWPPADAWDAFNKTVGGRLIATVPIGAVCHDTFPGVEYNAQKCAEIQDSWTKPELHEATTHSTMAAFWANMSCDPFAARDAPCSVGAYVQYVVRATGPDDYRKTIAFAAENNIRLVIRNTGHDYLGKSTGAGALALWTHHMKDTSIINYNSEYYTGKALKLGAGVSAGEAQALANSEGFLVVDGDCPTVGITGGYLQGGGSSPLASKFGLAVDSVLEWEAITADGTHVTATPTNQYSDLYWALSGGGGGTFGAVLSVTVRLHKNMNTVGATLQFAEPDDIKFWDVLPTFLGNLPALVKAGASVYWQVIPPAYTGLPGNFFNLPQLYFPDGSIQELERLLDPTFIALKSHGIQYGFVPKAYPTY